MNKIKRAFARTLAGLRIWKYRLLSSSGRVQGCANFVQPVLINGPGQIVFGGDVYLGTEMSPFFYSGYCYIETRHSDARISFEDHVWTNNNLTIISQRAGITIGSNTIIGTNVEIYDCDFHDLHPSSRMQTGISEPVRIGRNVWIGSNAKVLKGVTIGDNSVIGNGAVVASDVPNDEVWGGVPARHLRNL